MVMRRTAGIGTTAFVILGMASWAGAQAASDPNNRQSTPVAASSSRQTGTIQVTGCLVKESDYRRAHNLGEGALNGVGLGDEFVLVDTTLAAGAAPTSGTPTTSARPSPNSATSASCNEQGTGTAYRVTGKGEDNLKALVGHRVEITGSFKEPADNDSTSKLPREVEMSSYREAPVTTAAAAPMAVAPQTPRTPAASVADNTPRTPEPAPPASQPRTDRRTLSATASNTPLIALSGLALLIAAFSLSFAPRRT